MRSPVVSARNGMALIAMAASPLSAVNARRLYDIMTRHTWTLSNGDWSTGMRLVTCGLLSPNIETIIVRPDSR